MASDRHFSRTQSAGGVVPEVAPALDSFVSEATLHRAASTSETPRHPLWQFPEERPSTPEKSPAVRRVAAYASLAAAVLIAAVAGAWWGSSIPSSPPVATRAIAEGVQSPPIVAPADVPGDLPVQLISSSKVEPSTRPPVANVFSTVTPDAVDRIENPPPKPVALSAAVIEQRRSQERAISTRGTSGGAFAPVMPRPAPRPPAEPLPAAPMVEANPAVRLPVPEPAPALETPPASPPPPSRAAPAMRPEAEALPSVVARTDQSEIQRTLGQYRSAYQLLDAQAARAVWPSVDVRALARAFDGLTSQELAFDTCLFEIAGEAATAQCRGSASYTPKIGGRAARLESRQWTFHLRKLDEGWKIQSVQARR
jgi:hypothetical protein